MDRFNSDINRNLPRREFLELLAKGSAWFAYLASGLPSFAPALKRVSHLFEDCLVPRKFNLDEFEPSQNTISTLWDSYLTNQDLISQEYWGRIATRGLAPIANLLFGKYLLDNSIQEVTSEIFDSFFETFICELEKTAQEYSLPFFLLVLGLYSTGRFNYTDIPDQIKDVFISSAIQQIAIPTISQVVNPIQLEAFATSVGNRLFALTGKKDKNPDKSISKAFSSTNQVTLGSLDQRVVDILDAVYEYSPKDTIHRYKNLSPEITKHYEKTFFPARVKYEKSKEKLLNSALELLSRSPEIFDDFLCENEQNSQNFEAIGISKKPSAFQRTEGRLLMHFRNIEIDVEKETPDDQTAAAQTISYYTNMNIDKNERAKRFLLDQLENPALWRYLRNRNSQKALKINKIERLQKQKDRAMEALKLTIHELNKLAALHEYDFSSSIIEMTAFIKMLHETACEYTDQPHTQAETAIHLFLMMLNRERAQNTLLAIYDPLTNRDVDIPFVREELSSLVQQVVEGIHRAFGIYPKDNPYLFLYLFDQTKIAYSTIGDMKFDRETKTAITLIRSQGQTAFVFSVMVQYYLIYSSNSEENESKLQQTALDLLS